jgi:hypothetical protein
MKTVLGLAAVIAVGFIYFVLIAPNQGWWPNDDNDNGTTVPTSLAEATPTAAVSDDSSLSEAEVRKIAEEVAAEAATESGLSETEVQSLINDALENISPVDGLSEAQVRRIVRAELMILLTQVPADRAAVSGSSNASGDNEQVSTGSMPNLPHDVSHNGWTIKLADSAVDRGDDPATKWPYEDGMVGRVLERLKAPEPGNWQTAPNVPNTLAPSFDVGAGLEYTGDWNTPFCQQDMRCDFVVPAGSFRYVAGDYGFLDVDNCSGSKDTGYQLWLVNVGDSHIWRNQCADNGGTRHGRFRDGGRLDQGLWGGVSHETANMFNMPTISNANSGEVLNADGDSSNAGANCGVRTENCQFVDILIVIHAGDRILATAHTVVTHP